MTDRISVIGLGKLGTPMLAVFAAAGFEVVGVDTDENAVTAINQGIAPDGVVEPGLQKLLTKYRANYRATVDIYEAVKSTDATFVIVPTPTGDDGGFVLDYIEPVARDIGRTLAQKDAWHLVVITSTVMPGQTHEIAAMIEQESGKRCGDGFGLCYSPEFIALGSVVHDFQYPDYALIGCEDDRAGDALEAIYRCVHENPKGAPIVRMNWVNAEIAKIAQNSYITMKIAFANQLGLFCSTVPGANVDDVTRALGHDRRIGPHYLKAGTAFGGPCFPRDNRALLRAAEQHNVYFGQAELTDQFNRYMITEFSHAIAKYEGDKIGIIGLAYKPGTPVIEESQSIYLAKYLVAVGMDVIVYDPLAMDEARAVLFASVRYAESASECVKASDVVVLMHPADDWDEPLMLFASQEDFPSDKTLIDPWRAWMNAAPDLVARGWRYLPMGVRPNGFPCRIEVDGVEIGGYMTEMQGGDA